MWQTSRSRASHLAGPRRQLQQRCPVSACDQRPRERRGLAVRAVRLLQREFDVLAPFEDGLSRTRLDHEFHDDRTLVVARGFVEVEESKALAVALRRRVAGVLNAEPRAYRSMLVGQDSTHVDADRRRRTDALQSWVWQPVSATSRTRARGTVRMTGVWALHLWRATEWACMSAIRWRRVLQSVTRSEHHPHVAVIAFKVAVQHSRGCRILMEVWAWGGGGVLGSFSE